MIAKGQKEKVDALTDPHVSKKLPTGGKFGMAGIGATGTQRVLVAGGSGQVNSMVAKSEAGKP